MAHNNFFNFKDIETSDVYFMSESNPSKKKYDHHVFDPVIFNKATIQADDIIDEKLFDSIVPRHLGKENRSSNMNKTEVPEYVKNFVSKINLNGNENTFSNKENIRHIRFDRDSEEIFSREEFLQSIQKFQTPEYARKFFRKRMSFHFKKSTPPKERIRFRTDVIGNPLMKNLPRHLQKTAIQLFRDVLCYQRILVDKPQDACVEEIVSELYKNPPLRNEIYAHLVCQTTSYNNEEWCINAWKLFLIIASIFPSSRDIEIWILSHISMMALNPPFNSVSELTRFTYIRFENRISKGKVIDIINRKNLLSIPENLNFSVHKFGISLYEHLWQQSIDTPNLKVPYVLVQISKMIIKKGGFRTENIFRIPGNMKFVEYITEETGKTLENALGECSVHELASLLKQWLRDLPISVIPSYLIPELVDAVEGGDPMILLQKMPETHLNTFYYTIGFLKECVEHKEVTKMNAESLSLIFSPNFVSLDDSSQNPEGMKELFKVCSEFLKEMILTLDTKKYYPVKGF